MVDFIYLDSVYENVCFVIVYGVRFVVGMIGLS